MITLNLHDYSKDLILIGDVAVIRKYAGFFVFFNLYTPLKHHR